MILKKRKTSKTVYKKKLCYGCLGNISKVHNAKSCDNRRMCKVCSGRHPTVLHGLKIQKYKKKGNNEDIDTKEDKAEEVKCASTNTGSDVINMCIVPVLIKSKNTSKKVHAYALPYSCSQGTFISDQLANDLGVSGRKTSLAIKTLNGEFTRNSTALEGFKVARVSVKITMNGYLFQEHSPDQISQLTMMILQNHLSLGSGVTWKMSQIS